MTSALLHRSRSFVRLAGRPVDVLTFDPLLDAPATEAELRDRGELIPRMRLLNVWDWLGERTLAATPGTALDADPALPADASPGSGRRRIRYAADGATVVRIDHHRPDGTRFAIDSRDASASGSGRRVVLLDRHERAVRVETRVWTLYEEWLDELTASGPAFLIADSKPVARFLLSYRRAHASTIHVVHGSHLAGDSRSKLRPTRERVFRNLHALDSVVLLSERQRRDVVRLVGPRRNLAVIPNGRDLPDRALALEHRRRGDGVVLSALTNRKRVQHATEAVAVARTRSGADLRLDVYGDGTAREELEATLGADAGVITLHGHDPGARRMLPLASFLLLTSTSEGFPLVLIEAMAAGCLPIAYDVRYGPADLIADGRNGFLVPDGDIAALADAIIRLQRMPTERVARMRRAARATAERFSDLEVTRRWAAQLGSAAVRQRERVDGRLWQPHETLESPGAVPLPW
jgi:poly(glycerol-phosphate) alpha-glucosyltransferase